MDPYFIWAIVGLVMAIVAMRSGTFHLLMPGIAAFGGAVAAYSGFGFPVQRIVAGGGGFIATAMSVLDKTRFAGGTVKA